MKIRELIEQLIETLSRVSNNGTMTSVNASTQSVQLLPANRKRVGAAFYNDSNNTMYLAVSHSPASLSEFTMKCPPGFYISGLEVDYKGPIHAIWNGSSGVCHITEWTA